MGVKLSEIIQALHQDDQMRKLAQDAMRKKGVDSAIDPSGQATPTESPVSEQVSDTIEDEKAKIQTKLMELAGLQDEAASAAKEEEELNVAQEAPAGEAVNPPGVDPAASAAASEPEEMATVVASALSKLQPAVRKQACVKIIEKIAQLNALTLDDVKKEKIAAARFDEYDAAGRIMARAYHDELQKLAAEAPKNDDAFLGLEPSEKKGASEEKPDDVTDEDLKVLEAILG